MWQNLLSIQHSHDLLRIFGAIGAGLVLLSCLALSLMPKRARFWFIIPAVTVTVGAVTLIWSLSFLES